MNFIDNFQYPINELSLSDSSLKTYRHGCGRKLELGKFMDHANWRGGPSSLAADVGTALHHAYQEYLRTKDRDWAVHQLAAKYPWALMNTDSNQRSIWAAISALETLLSNPHLLPYELAQIVDKNGDVQNAVEVGFKLNSNMSIDAGNGKIIPVAYTGFMDAILFNKATNTYSVLDVKTTRNLPPYDLYFRNEEQCLPYGFVVNHLTGQPLERFQVHYLVIYVDLMQPKAQVLTFEKTAEDIRRWALNFYLDVQKIQEQMRFNAFAKHGASCLSYGRRCSFFDNECPIDDRDYVSRMIANYEQTWQSSKRPEPMVELDLHLAGE